MVIMMFTHSRANDPFFLKNEPWTSKGKGRQGYHRLASYSETNSTQDKTVEYSAVSTAKAIIKMSLAVKTRVIL